MASSLEIVKSCGSPVSISRHKSPVRLESRKRVFRVADSRSWHRLGRCVRVCSSSLNGDNQSKGDEPPESLFMKELKRRGMTPTSLLQDYEVDVDEIKTGKESGSSSSSKTTATTPAFDQSLLNQRERSLALNSEGLEGLIPRAKVLLTIGGTFFLGFWPLIVLTLGAFSALYVYFGADFVHDGSRTPVSPPPYIDPYTLLEDERISGIDPRVN
uniref:Tubulin alpha-6 chain n=1 Tax=Noccaea caerulescens TaxID=107243 RepID=A0A1J3HCU2_NOCCA